LSPHVASDCHYSPAAFGQGCPSSFSHASKPRFVDHGHGL
jgi:hypothetical protein